MIQEFDEPIRVIIRQRPPNQNDLKDENFNYAWNLTEENNLGNIGINPKIQHQIKKTRPNFQKEPFNYDSVYDQNAKTEDIYEKEMKPIVLKAMNNSENGIIFLYGQTGAGKTFTMIGERDNESLKKEQSYLGTQYNTQKKNNKNNLNQQSQTILSKTFKSFESEQQENNSNNISLNSLQGGQQIDYQQSQGILTMCFNEIFEQINCIKETSPFDHFSIYCSYLEIYNEKIYDLLKKYNNQDELQSLELRETEDKKFQAQGAEKEVVSTIDEIFQILEKGEINRHYAQTKMNLQSSRSHTIFKIEIKQQQAQQLQEKVSQLTFVDLAGSEKYNIHDDLSGSKRRIRQEEQKNICKSLFNLARVVSLISEQQEIQIKNQEIQAINNNQVKNQFSQNNLQKKSQKNPIYIPFRDSILTKILKEAFGGNCHCTFICCINPSQKEIDISYNTLQFAQRAKKIVNKLKKCQVYKKLSLQNLQDTYLAYQDKIKELENIMQLNSQDSGQKNIKNLKQSPDFLRNSSIYKQLKQEKDHVEICLKKIEEQSQFNLTLQERYDQAIKDLQKQKLNYERQKEEIEDYYDKQLQIQKQCQNSLQKKILDQEQQIQLQNEKNLADQNKLYQIIHFYQNLNYQGLQNLEDLDFLKNIQEKVYQLSLNIQSQVTYLQLKKNLTEKSEITKQQANIIKQKLQEQAKQNNTQVTLFPDNFFMKRKQFSEQLSSFLLNFDKNSSSEICQHKQLISQIIQQNKKIDQLEKSDENQEDEFMKQEQIFDLINISSLYSEQNYTPDLNSGDYQKQTQRKIQGKQQVNSFSKNDKSTQKKKNESIFDQLIQNVSQEFTL